MNKIKAVRSIDPFQYKNISFYSTHPFSETYDTFIKTKKLIFRERKYHGSKRAFEQVLQKYFLTVFNLHSIQILPKLVRPYVSIGRYSRFIPELEQIASFFLVTITIPISDIRIIDKTAKLLNEIAEELTLFALNLKLYLFDLEWKTIEKILFNKEISLSDLPVSPNDLKEQKLGYVFSTITNDIEIFSKNGKMTFINRPDSTTPNLQNIIPIGKSIKDQRPVGLSSKRLILFGNHSKKIQHIILNYLDGLSLETADHLTLIYNFNDFSFSLPFDLPYAIKRLTPPDFNLDPFLLMQEYPEIRNNIVRALIHIFELLPSEVGPLQGTIAEYYDLKDKDNSLPASLGDFNSFVKRKATQDVTEDILENTLVETKGNEGFDISPEEVSLSTLENQGSIINRSYLNIENKLKYLISIMKKKKSSPIPLLLRKKGTIYLQATQTTQHESLLAFFLLTEIANTIEKDFTLIILGLDTILSTIHNFSQQSFFRQYIHITQRENYLLQIKEFNMRYMSFIQLLGSEVNNIWTDTIYLNALNEKFHFMLRDNSDIGILQRADDKSLFIPFSISEKLRNNDLDTEKQTKERLKRNSIDKFSHLDPLSTVEEYELLEFIHNQPNYLNYPENIAIQNSEYYFDGLERIDLLKRNGYLKRTSKIESSLSLTPEAKILIDTIPHYMDQFQSMSLKELKEMNNYNLDLMLPGLIKNDLPKLNWKLLLTFFQYIHEIIPKEKTIENLLDYSQGFLHQTKDLPQNDRASSENNYSASLVSSIRPPDINKYSDTVTIAPGFQKRTDTIDENFDSVTRPTSDKPIENEVPTPVSTRQTLKQDYKQTEIRYKKTKSLPNISKNIITFPVLNDKIITDVPHLDELNRLSIGENKKVFSSIILLGKDTQNNKSSALFSIIDEYYNKD